MNDITRRELLGSMLIAGAAQSSATRAAACEAIASGREPWARGTEGQRKADLGDGTFLNPILSGDHADPSILKDGDDYYMTFSSFDAYPGVVIWHSLDLVNWAPLVPALKTPIGSVWACELIRHDGRYYIYIPARTPSYRSIYVIHADNIHGPWS
jgi:xylan 1,4-beta-xylosidase